MKAMVCVLLFGWTVLAHAKPISQNDMVGTWHCYSNIDSDDDGKIRNQTVDVLRKDGTMSQIWETAYYDNDGNLSDVEFFVIKNRWKFKNNQMSIYDWQLLDYRLYNRYKSLASPDTIARFKSHWQEEYNKPYTNELTFLSKDEFIYDVVSDVDGKQSEQSGCRRLP